jgi:type 1 glutamine amidotransferase
MVLLASCVSAPRPAGLEGARILVFSHTTGYRHEAIGAAVPAITRLIVDQGGVAVASEEPAMFDAGRLAGFDAVVFLSTTTDPQRPESEWLTGPRREALQAFVRRGGGIVGIHAASDSHYHWPWYGEMLGGRFQRHPRGTQRGRLTVIDATHPATASLPSTIAHTDEWYAIRDWRPGSGLLLTLDPASIGEPAGAPWPISWSREFEGGKVFYTALGHTPETYAEPFFLDHLRGGLAWATQR